jgi:hypothetical protein
VPPHVHGEGGHRNHDDDHRDEGHDLSAIHAPRGTRVGPSCNGANAGDPAKVNRQRSACIARALTG